MGTETTWLRYVDDVFVLVPEGVNLREKLDLLNAVEKKTQLTLETEDNGVLLFLDILIMNQENGAKFTVYRKETNHEDYFHYFSAHSGKIKSGVII